MDQITYLEAIKNALDEEMEKDQSVFLLGEDIGVYGGAFRVTEGFYEKYGEWRVLDTPLSESGFIGAAIGAAVMGLRPVAEVQFADFISCAFDQLVNVAAKFHYRLGTAVPLVVRAPYGGNIHGGAFHSQCIEGFFFNVPGLKIVAPSTVYDAKGLLKASIRDNDPVIFCEHKFLYRRIKDSAPKEEYTVPIGKARVAKEGTDLSLITYGAMVHTALDAAHEMEAQGISVEIVDLRTILPMDKNAIIETVKKTNKVIILHEQTKTGGVGAEVSAVISESCFEYLDGPIIRIAAPDTPVPYSPQMEERFIPQVKDVVAAIEKLAHF